MADIQLNKPLYKPEGEEGFTPPTPRQPRSSLFGRSAALFLDVMLLHLVLGAVTRLVPDIPLALGPVAPWVGLLIGYLYFGFGFCHLTLGRTLGKLITRVQVADLAGPDLSVGRAFWRAALLLWPLAVHQCLRSVAEYYGNNDPASIYTTLEIFGTMLILGWVLGNLGFAVFDPYRRTMYDRIAGSIIINAELEPSAVNEYLAGARAADQMPPPRSALTSLGFALTVCLAFATASAISVMGQLKKLTPAERDRVEAMVSPEFGRAWPAPPLAENTTTGTIPVSFNFRHRGKIDMEAVKANPATSETLDRLIKATMGPDFVKEIQQYLSSANLDRMRRGEAQTSAPEAIHFEVSFTEYADLFFAREAHPVYTLSKDVDLPTTVTEAVAQ